MNDPIAIEMFINGCCEKEYLYDLYRRERHVPELKNQFTPLRLAATLETYLQDYSYVVYSTLKPTRKTYHSGTTKKPYQRTSFHRPVQPSREGTGALVLRQLAAEGQTIDQDQLDSYMDELASEQHTLLVARLRDGNVTQCIIDGCHDPHPPYKCPLLPHLDAAGQKTHFTRLVKERRASQHQPLNQHVQQLLFTATNEHEASYEEDSDFHQGRLS